MRVLFSIIVLLALACDPALLEEPLDTFDSAEPPLPDSHTPVDTSLPDTVPPRDFETPPPIPAEIFAHGPDTLYRLDPDAAVLRTLGPFQGCSSVIDLAIDLAGQIYVTTSSGLFRVDRNTVQCTLIAWDSYPNSLTFIPPGLLHPADEVLVGYFGSDYVQIDVETGAITTLGSLGLGYASSGDLISVPGGGTYLTATGPDCLSGDCLLEVDPISGDLRARLAQLPYGTVYGMAYSRGKAYGFASSGVAFEMIFEEDQTITTQRLSLPGNPTFWGASSLWTP